MAITDPRDIPGLLAWYSAEAETGYADGQEMTQWTDLSGNGNHALPGVTGVAPVWDSTWGPSGGPAVVFEGEFWKLPNGLMSGLTQGSAAVTLRARINNQGFWLLSSSGNLAHFPYGSTIYDTFGAGYQETVSSVSLDTWYRYMATSKASEWKAYLDGTNVRTSTTNPVGFPTGTPYLGASANDSWHFRGRMSLFVAYDHVLTSTERGDLETWMAANPSGGTVAAAPSPIVVTGEAFAVAATALDGTPRVAVRVAGDLAAAAAVMLDGTIPVVTPIVVTGDPFAAAATALDGTGRLLVTGDPFATSADFLNGNIVGASILVTGEAFAAAALSVDGWALLPPERIGFGLVLDSAASLVVEPTLDVDADTVPLHVIVPTVPVPVLANGRPV